MAVLGLVTGCNALFGIHEIDIDAGSTVDADPCTGTCECHVDSDCADSHAVCIDAITTRTCDCAAGYGSGSSGGACAWVGVVADAAFLQSAGPWVGSNNAIVDANGSGDGDFGVGVLTDPLDHECQLSPALGQTITMPRLSRAQPLVLQMTYRNSDGFETPRLVAGVGGTYYEDSLLYAESNWVTTRSCLGAAQFAPETSTGSGVAMPLAIAGDNQGGFGPQCELQNPETRDLEVDQLDIVPANVGECPAIGSAINGDAEGSGGWVFSSSDYTAGDGASASIVANVGEDNSHGVELFLAQRCDGASASVPISFPVADATGSPSISIYHSANYNSLELEVDSYGLPLSGNGAPSVDRYCVPAPLVGGVFDLDAYVSAPSSGSNLCTDVVDASAVVDNVVITNDPLCGGDPGIADPGFESPTPLLGTNNSAGATALSVADAHAHGGARDLQLTVSQNCFAGEYDAAVATPAFASGAGPAVTFWYQATAGMAEIDVGSRNNTLPFTAVRDGTWHQATVCLDPTIGRRPQYAYFYIEQEINGVACSVAEPAETLLIDDLATTTDAACPAM